MTTGIELIYYKCMEYLNISFNDFKINKEKRHLIQNYSFILKKYCYIQIGNFSIYPSGLFSESIYYLGGKIQNNIKTYELESSNIKFSSKGINRLNNIKEIFGNKTNKFIDSFILFSYLIQKNTKKHKVTDTYIRIATYMNLLSYNYMNKKYKEIEEKLCNDNRD